MRIFFVFLLPTVLLTSCQSISISGNLLGHSFSKTKILVQPDLDNRTEHTTTKSQETIDAFDSSTDNQTDIIGNTDASEVEATKKDELEEKQTTETQDKYGSALNYIAKICYQIEKGNLEAIQIGLRDGIICKANRNSTKRKEKKVDGSNFVKNNSDQTNDSLETSTKIENLEENKISINTENNSATAEDAAKADITQLCKDIKNGSFSAIKQGLLMGIKC